ncbi:hypothetical protein P8452_39095 [Trifolium repens]|nr:hypothetical protein P8452_39095 [Trifolium repens]
MLNKVMYKKLQVLSEVVIVITMADENEDQSSCGSCNRGPSRFIDQSWDGGTQGVEGAVKKSIQAPTSTSS